MASEDAAVERFDVARLRRQVLRQELRERALPDEADAGAVLLVEHGQRQLARDLAHGALVHCSNRKEGSGERRGRHRMQEIALILLRIESLEQPWAGGVFDLSIVSGGDPVGAEALRVFEAHAEFDFPVAQHVRIRGASGAVFLEKVGENALPVFTREADLVQRRTQQIAHSASVLIVLRRRAIAALVLIPIAHEQTLHVVTLLLKQVSGDGRVDAAGHADDHERGRHPGRLQEWESRLRDSRLETRDWRLGRKRGPRQIHWQVPALTESRVPSL